VRIHSDSYRALNQILVERLIVIKTMQLRVKFRVLLRGPRKHRGSGSHVRSNAFLYDD